MYIPKRHLGRVLTSFSQEIGLGKPAQAYHIIGWIICSGTLIETYHMIGPTSPTFESLDSGEASHTIGLDLAG